jgi:hypothetical protein
MPFQYPVVEVGPFPMSPVPTQKLPFLSALSSAEAEYLIGLGIIYFKLAR